MSGIATRPVAHVFASSLLVVAPALRAQDESGADRNRSEVFVARASDEARLQMRTFQIAPGLACELVAAEPDLCNAVAFQVDERGRFWVVETFRINDGVFDTRNYMQWKDEDLALRTVAERVAMYQRHIAAKMPDYSAFPERIRLLTDSNGDGQVDRSTVFADGFRDPADGIAAGVLCLGEDVWFTNIPKLWRLRDTDGDGMADQQTAVFDGFGVHVSLIGHDLHGLILGPDRRLYFSIGDRGLHTVTREGRTLDLPHEGAVLRCELDGSNLEVFHRGLRNPQELAFDQRGDLFTGDNNSDGGDQARFVFLLEGGDCGWHIGHQWLDDRGRWNRERMWQPWHPGQPAWIVPPIANVADGPSGLVYDTGMGLPERYRGHFFLCDFRGGSSNSGVRALSLNIRGAGFELASMQQPIWRVLCTDVDIGPDGSLYVLDWVDGWTKTGKGRIYRLRAPEARNDLKLRGLAQTLAADFAPFHDQQLLNLLGHDDRRVRQKAQFALVDKDARSVLEQVAAGPDRQLARLHAIWGLGILGRRTAAAVTPCIVLLKDGDAEVRAQAAKVLGDARWTEADASNRRKMEGELCRIVREDTSSRARLQAALALGRCKAAAERAVPALLELLRDNADRDPWLRHGASNALAELGDRARLHAAVRDKDPAVRLGVLLALRRRLDPELQQFLDDPLPALRTEAARAILDASVTDALPALAAMAAGERSEDEFFTWRVLNANRIVGTPDCGRRLLAFARDPQRPEAMRVEALRILGEWSAPHGQDRVVGDWRPIAHPDAATVTAAVAEALPALLQDPVHTVAGAAAEASGRLLLAAAAPALLVLVAARERPVQVREGALQALEQLNANELDGAVAAIDADAPGRLREAAVRIFATRNPKQAASLLATLLQNGSRKERRGAFAALGQLQDPAAATLLCQQLDLLAEDKVDGAVQLELLEAAGKRSEPDVQQRLRAREQALAKDELAPFRPSLHGGDSGRGRELFFQNEQARCQRCHTIDGRGGNAGPKLDGIGGRVDRLHLLQAMVAPSAKIAEGYATVLLHLHNGDLVAGVVVKDQDGAVEVMDVDGKTTTVPWDRIKQRAGSVTSSMPPVGGVLKPRELRDLVEFLASLK